MRRVLLLLPLLLATAAVVWSGLGWPPPLWIVEYGLPGSQGPTGRVARIEGIEFVEISPGYFRMGSFRGRAPGDLPGRLARPVGLPWGRSPASAPNAPASSGREASECWIEIPRPFWMASKEVTSSQFAATTDSARHPERLPNRVVTGVTRDQAERFCSALGDGRIPVRLPTEAEWECACRAGSTSRYCFGDDPAELTRYARFEGEAPGDVGTRRPNAWGLYDMHGGVWEWCGDDWHDSHAGQPRSASAWRSRAGTSLGTLRGGGWGDPADRCTSSDRDSYPAHEPGGDNWDIGFRPAFSLTPDQEHLVEPYLVKRR